jgi:general secretion pathway protein G
MYCNRLPRCPAARVLRQDQPIDSCPLNPCLHSAHPETVRRGAPAARPARAPRGFTLIELIITVMVVALLATVAFPMAEVAVQRSKEQELRASLREIRSAIDAHKQAVEEGRIIGSPQQTGYPPTLKILAEGVIDAKSPKRDVKIYFLRRIPRDPFATDPSVPADETWGLRSYASPPDDPQVGEDVYDVYSRSTGVGLNGIPYRQW